MKVVYLFACVDILRIHNSPLHLSAHGGREPVSGTEDRETGASMLAIITDTWYVLEVS